MKFAVVIDYSQDQATIKRVAAAHHDYLNAYLVAGTLLAAGPFTNQQGALWIMEAESPEALAAVVRGDPYHDAGVFVKWEIHPLAYWSAKQHKGSLRKRVVSPTRAGGAGKCRFAQPEDDGAASRDEDSLATASLNCTGCS